VHERQELDVPAEQVVQDESHAKQVGVGVADL